MSALGGNRQVATLSLTISSRLTLNVRHMACSVSVGNGAIADGFPGADLV
jgi:hypothetical protein